jgi:hypothetical protein
MVGASRPHWLLLQQVAFLAWNGAAYVAQGGVGPGLGTPASTATGAGMAWLLLPAPLVGAPAAPGPAPPWQLQAYYGYLALTALLRYGALRDAVLPFQAGPQERWAGRLLILGHVGCYLAYAAIRPLFLAGQVRPPRPRPAIRCRSVPHTRCICRSMITPC